jgi:hypothetical protein
MVEVDCLQMILAPVVASSIVTVPDFALVAPPGVTVQVGAPIRWCASWPVP